MSKNAEVVYLPNVKKFIVKLDDVLIARVLNSIDFLEKYGHLLSIPLSKSIGKGLFELRILGSIQIRFFYCFRKDIIYILHAIIKKQQAIPKKDIEFARKTMKVVVLI